MRLVTLILLSVALLFISCKKDKNAEGNCIVPDIVPFQPYYYPVWHPNGQILGFNYTPLAGIGSNGVAPCIWYSYLAKPDSTGFYIMNKDGTGLKRITNYNLYTPAWSPDGNWLAFSLGSQIYKMRFTLAGFDTVNIIQLTTDGGNFHPSWALNSDTIYFDSNNNSPIGASFYSIWKMSTDGTIKTRLTQSAGIGDTRYPYVGSDSKIYFTQYVSGKAEIFSMDRNGLNQVQFSHNGFSVENPKYFQGKIFYEANQIGVILNTGSRGIKLVSPAVTYDISTNGEIIYSKMEYDIMKYNKQIGTLWIMNSDGSNNHQLTFNNF